MLVTSLADHKYIILQKLAKMFEQPVAEQIEVFTAAAFSIRASAMSVSGLLWNPIQLMEYDDLL